MKYANVSKEGGNERSKKRAKHQRREKVRGLKWLEKARKLESRESWRSVYQEVGGGERRGNEAGDCLYTSSLWKLIGRELEGTNLSTLPGKCSATDYEG